MSPMSAMAAGLLAALVLGPLGALIWRAEGLGVLRAAELAALRFTLLQAALSALLSCALAVPVARALYRRRFWGREALITALGAPFILPTMVAVMGLIAIFGRKGPVNAGLAALGLPELSLYGLQGILAAHVFLNLPLAVRMVLHGWQGVPVERLRLALALGFSRRDIGRHIERPMLRMVLPSAFLAIFLVCLTSFSIALTLGGGPRSTTLEVAIYQAFRFDFDLARAASLGLLQVGVCLMALGLAKRLTAPPSFGAGLGLAGPALKGHWADYLLIAACAGYFFGPMLALISRGLPALFSLPPSVLVAAGNSLWIALGSTALALALALPLALSRRGEVAAMLPMASSSLVLGTGLFLLLRAFASPQSLALPITALTNAALATPFIYRILRPEVLRLEAEYGRLCAALGLTGLARLRLVTLPRLARPLGFSAGLSAAFAMGDLGAIALFSDSRVQTLPSALYSLMSAYRMGQAAAAALVLMALSFGLFWGFDRIGRYADTR